MWVSFYSSANVIYGEGWLEARVIYSFVLLAPHFIHDVICFPLQETASLFSLAFSLPRCHLLLFDFWDMGMLRGTYRVEKRMQTARRLM